MSPRRGISARAWVPAAVATVVLLALAPAASADVLLDESFAGPTANVPLRTGGSFVPCLTASVDTSQANVRGCPAGQPSIPVGGDPNGQGALRLTDNANNRSGFAIYRHAFPFTYGVRFTFTTFAYNGTRFPGYGAADGVSVFLADGSVGATTPGAFGGSLGYAQKSIDFDATVPDVGGVPGGYVGVGIDEFGNFANDREARGYGCAQRVDLNLHPNYVSLRGAGVAGSDWMRGYCLLDRTPAPGVLDAPDATSRSAPGVAHAFRLEIDPLALPDGTENGSAHVRLFADMAGSGVFVPVLDAPLPPNPPATFEFGLAASTGAGTNIHEVRALRLETIADLPEYTLVKTHATDLVAGRAGTFTVQAGLAPTGGSAYSPVKLVDTLPAGLTVAGAPHGDGWSCDTTVVGTATATCTYDASLAAPLRPGTALPPVTVPVDVAPDADGHLVNLARLTGAEIVTRVEAEDPFDLARSADVGIVKRADPARIAVGERTAFTLLVTNRGPSDARDVVVTDTIPAGLDVADVLPTLGTCTHDATSVRCELGTLRAGASAQVVIDATANATAAGRTLPDVAVVTADPDDNPINNTARASVTVDANPPSTGGGGEPTLEVTKQPAEATVRVGVPLLYTLSVHNAGTETARDVRLTDTATMPGTIVARPALRRQCDRDLAVIRCRLGDIPAGETLTVRALVTLHRAGEATNAITVAPADGPLPDRSEIAEVTVQGGAALDIRKTARPARVRVGGLVRYEITVRSLGPRPAVRVRICDRLPRELSLLSAPGGRGRRVVCWTLPGLPAGASRTFTVLARAVRPSGGARNVATARARNASPVRADRRVAVIERPCPSSRLAVTPIGPPLATIAC